jgi:hypothetical protein
MCHANKQRTEVLTLVLLGICTAYKEDLQSSATHLVYDEPLWASGELLVPATPKVEESIFIQQLRRHMDQLWPTLAAHHSSPATLRTSGTQPTCSCGKMPSDAPWNQYTSAHTKSLLALTKHSKLSCVANKSPYPQTELHQLTYWEEISITPAVHQPIIGILK